MKMNIAADIGNSQTKMVVGDKVDNYSIFKQPSVIRRVMKLPVINDDSVKKIVNSLDDHLTVHISSPAIKEGMDGLYVIGKKAMTTDIDEIQNMNIKLGNKHKHDIPIIMVISMIAQKTIQDSFDESGELKEAYDVECDLSTAIPASEFTFKKAKSLEERFLKGFHIVVAYIGEKKVTVSIDFTRVKVMQEGMPAIFALMAENQNILDNHNKINEKQLKLADLKNLRLFHVDIGDGTNEYIPANGLNPILDACSGEKRGVGHATEKALVELNESLDGMLGNINRQKFMDIYNDKSHHLHAEAKRCLESAKIGQANLILEDVITKISSKVGNDVDLILVYGGGSIQFRKYLEEDLNEYANQIRASVLWVPEEIAVDLNAKGLHVLNHTVFFKNKKTATK
ncbi:ParM/StbA family protein [Bacillus pumilus]|uniref:ParM/StbA family protein n=2 Tax=Bacillaceae TaxID=186817 RepID=UPI0011A95726|nr:ParM/StbA family protein [Bacillus pumilus]